MTSPKTLARIAGSLYLVVAVLGGFAELYVRSSIVVAGDAAGTADNIRASATLFRVGFMSDLAQAIFFLLTAMALYLLLRDVHELVARAMVVFVAVSVAIICLNLLNQYVALSIATGGESRSIFGLWLLPLGYLVYRSGYFPKVLGVLLAIGCFGYLADLFTHFLAPGIAESIEPLVVAPAAVGELSLVAWLLVKGVNFPRRVDDVPASVENVPAPA